MQVPESKLTKTPVTFSLSRQAVLVARRRAAYVPSENQPSKALDPQSKIRAEGKRGIEQQLDIPPTWSAKLLATFSMSSRTAMDWPHHGA